MSHIMMIAPMTEKSAFFQFGKCVYENLTDLTIIGTESGLDDVIDYYQIEYNLGPILHKVMEIEKTGNCDALIIGCFADPGLMAVRQVTSMPVLGAGEVSLCTAAMMGDRIGIVIPEMQFKRLIEEMVRKYGFGDRVAAVRSAEEFVPGSVRTQPQESVKNMAETCCKIIDENDADVIILGCIGFAWMVPQVSDLLKRRGLKTPIIVPGIVTYNAAKMIIELGLNQDRRTFTCHSLAGKSGSIS